MSDSYTNNNSELDIINIFSSISERPSGQLYNTSVEFDLDDTRNTI